MSDEVDTRVSLALHPGGFDSIEGYDSDIAPAIADVVSAFRDAYVTVGRVWDATEAGKRNAVWTEEARVLAVGKVAAKEQDRLLRKMDAVMGNLGKGIAGIESELSRPLKERAGLGNLNVEVRQHAKALKPGDRAKLLNEAFDADDTDTLQAILGAQPFLSGMSAPEHAHYLRRFREKQSPALVARLVVMRGAMEKMGRDGTRVMVEMQKAVGAPPQKVRAIDAANERALAALRFPPAA